MDGSLRLPPLARLLTLNTEISELRTELMHQPFASGRIAELQEEIDRHYRSSLATCWLTGGYDLEAEDDEWEDDLSSAN
ncbi:hypothetical protein GBAR_LOCUS4355 [Geodia barretti]|uniref:Uncharacterized protein n=1 Tax=Geodia barretti TaxID=519541 RepID=A0AA35R6I2_GEOBA|nr:hypothetical protein GBAR_LOCUS4355 [Geodia barretti]